MTEQGVIQRTREPITIKSMVRDLRALGLYEGQTLLVHSSMSQIGWVCGGAYAVILALREVLGDEGTLMMPTHCSQNTDPINWRHPPVPQEWCQTIRENRPAYDPAVTPTREMGVVAELFRTLHGVKRSDHPIGSFAAVGKHADYLLANHHSLEKMFADESPIGTLYELGGDILLLGVGHGNNTSLHLAEYRADYPSKTYVSEGCAMMVDGQRQWVEFQMHDLDDEDFVQLGEAYHLLHGKTWGKVGHGDAILVPQRAIVDFAVDWMEANRT